MAGLVGYPGAGLLPVIACQNERSGKNVNCSEGE
jgi:hypothetical protein